MIQTNGQEGLEITFKKPLRRTSDGVGLGNTIFPFILLTSYDIGNQILVLRKDFQFDIRTDNVEEPEILHFGSGVPNTPDIFMHPRGVARVRDLSTRETVFPSS